MLWCVGIMFGCRITGPQRWGLKREKEAVRISHIYRKAAALGVIAGFNIYSIRRSIVEGCSTVSSNTSHRMLTTQTPDYPQNTQIPVIINTTKFTLAFQKPSTSRRFSLHCLTLRGTPIYQPPTYPKPKYKQNLAHNRTSCISGRACGPRQAPTC